MRSRGSIQIRAGLAVGIAFGLLAGCAGSRMNLTFEKLEVPVSLSGCIYSADNRVLSKADLEVVGALRAEVRIWAMVYSAARLTGLENIDQAINQKVKEAGGQGVVNLTIQSENCGINYWWGPNILPFWPGCTLVTVSGDIVKARPAPPVRVEEPDRPATPAEPPVEPPASPAPPPTPEPS